MTRLEIDKKFILNQDISTIQVLDFFINLFSEKYILEYIPSFTLEYFINIVLDTYKRTENDSQRQLIKHKIIHTKEVLISCWDILEGLDIPQDSKSIVYKTSLISSLFHDIGRFEQALIGTFSDKKSKFDHAKYGANIVNNFYWENKFINISVDLKNIYDAIYYHSDISYEGSNFYVKVVRDADKLAIFRYILEPNIFDTRSNGKPSNKNIDDFLNYKLVDNENIYTKGDVVLLVCSLYYDLNFDYSKELFLKEDIEKLNLYVPQVNILDKLKSFRLD